MPALAYHLLTVSQPRNQQCKHDTGLRLRTAVLVARSRSRGSAAHALVRTSMTRTIHQDGASNASERIVSR